LVGVVPPEHGPVVVVGVGVPAGGADIVPGGEVFTGTGEYDDVDVVVVDGPAERGIQRVGHRRVLRVTIVGPVHGDHRDAVPYLVTDHLAGCLVLGRHSSLLCNMF